MMDADFYHVIVYVPVKNADVLRAALRDAGAGAIGDYTGCSFSAVGTGRFCPGENASPAVGSPNQAQEVEEERIEVLAPKEKIEHIMQAAVKVHPYEEPAIHVLPLLDYKKFL